MARNKPDNIDNCLCLLFSGIPEYINTLHSAARNIQTSEDLYYCEKEQTRCTTVIEQDTNHSLFSS